MAQISSALTLSLHFTFAVFHQTRPFPDGSLRCDWAAADVIVYYRTGGVTGDNSIIYDFYFLDVRWIAHETS